VGEPDRAKGLFDTKTSTIAQLTEGTMNRMRIQQQSKALQTADMGIFLRTFPQVIRQRVEPFLGESETAWLSSHGRMLLEPLPHSWRGSPNRS
jgi:hypothetical protein